MYTLGISAFLDDPSAALLRDGKIVAIGEEERFIRVKHGVEYHSDKTTTSNDYMTHLHNFQVRHFPHKSIQYCLSKADISISALDHICLGFDLKEIIEYKERYKKQFSLLPEVIVKRRLDAFFSYFHYLKRMADKARAELFFVNHHLAHTYGAVFSSPYEKATTLTMDGMGDFTSSKLSIWNGKELETIVDIQLPNSIGRVYSSITNLLGFRQNIDEEKIMALAAFGKDSYRNEFKSFVKHDFPQYTVREDHVWTELCGMGYENPSPLNSLFKVETRGEMDPTKKPWSDIAKSLQNMLFEITSGMIVHALGVGGPRHLCMSGGVALNCENNGRLLMELDGLTNIHIQPQANDAGVALGAAYAVYFQVTGKRAEPMEHCYYGPDYPDDEILRMLSHTKHDFNLLENPAKEMAEYLESGAIVGWYRGAGEVGPRALGNRSILCNPSPPDMKYKINVLKKRERWRPFAASILNEDRAKLLQVDNDFPFMTIAVPVRADAYDKLSAASHINGTTRPQTVKKDVNPQYHALIKEYSKLTGLGALLNTSFNIRGEPIVNTPLEALLDFWRTPMDVLVLHNYVIKKNNQ